MDLLCCVTTCVWDVKVMSEEGIRQLKPFEEWTASVMAGVKRMNNDPEYRAKIDAMSAAASPKTTMRDLEPSLLKGSDTAHEHPR